MAQCVLRAGRGPGLGPNGPSPNGVHVVCSGPYHDIGVVKPEGRSQSTI